MEYTDMERRILDMWPKFEGGAYVQIGDSYVDCCGDDDEVSVVGISKGYAYLIGIKGSIMKIKPNGRLERPAPKVLDADGVPIDVGDVVYDVGDPMPAEVVEVDGDAVHVQYFDGFIFEHKAAQLSHERHDSWERLEEDARQLDINLNDTTDDYPRMNFARDLIRRAKALAEKEAAR